MVMSLVLHPHFDGFSDGGLQDFASHIFCSEDQLRTRLSLDACRRLTNAHRSARNNDNFALYIHDLSPLLALIHGQRTHTPSLYTSTESFSHDNRT